MACGGPRFKNRNTDKTKYEMIFKCINCGETFNILIDKGVAHDEEMQKCENCEIISYHTPVI